MKKQNLAAAALLLLLLTGCGSGKKQTLSGVVVDPNAAKAAAPAVTAVPAAAGTEFPVQEELTSLATEDPYAFLTNGLKILPRMEAAPILEALGAPAFTFEADSCAYQGKDIYYKYSGFELTVNVPEDVPLITAITVVDDTIRVTFPNGTLAIGDSEAKLLEVLGGESGQEQFYQKIADALTMLQSGGKRE